MRGLLGILLLACIAAAFPLRAQGPAENLAASAEEQFRSGNYKRAAEIYKEFIAKYPTSQLIFSVRYQYGLALLLDAQYDPSLKVFEELAKPSTPVPELREQAKLLLGNVYGGQAMSRSKEQRAPLLRKALDAFNAYLKEYGQKGVGVPDAVYGRAAVLLELEHFDEAIKDLEANAAGFANSKLAFEADQLLAKIYAAKASKLFKENKASEAEALLKKAEEKFEKVGTQEKNPVLANEAFFAAGKTFLDFGQNDRAIEYFRRVRPKNELIEFQQARLARLREERMDQIRQAGKESEALRAEVERETSKLNRLMGKYDLYLASQQYVAQIFLSQEKYDESIIVNERFMPFYDEELARLGQYQIVAATIGKGDFQKAEELALAFAEKHRDGPVGDDLLYKLAEKYLAAGNTDKALDLLKLSLEKHPQGAYAEASILTRASILSQLGRTDQAAEEYAKFMKMFAKSDLADRALYLRGLNYQRQGKFDLSTQDFRDLQKNYPQSKFKEDAFFRIGFNLTSVGKPNDAIEHLIRFEKLFPKSDLLSPVLYQLALAYESAGKIDQAIETHRRNAREQPSGDMAPYSLFSIGVIHYNQRRYDEMEKAFQDYIAKYPDHKSVPDAQNLMGYAHQLAKRYDKAVGLYEAVVRKNPDNEAGARAQLSIGLCHLAAATDAAFRPSALPKPEQEEWNQNMKKAVEAFSKVITAFPKSKQVDEALSNLVSAWRYRIDSGLAPKEEGQTAFKQLAETLADDRALQAKIQFTYGAFLFERGETAEALPVFENAFAASSGVTLPVESFKKYLSALLTSEPPSADKAIGVAQRMIEENKTNTAGLGEGYYWLGRAYFEKGDSAQAESYFEKVAKMPELAGTELEGQVKLFKGQIMERNKQYDEAIKIYQDLQKTMAVKFRVEPVMRMAYAFEAKGDAASLENAYKKFQEVVIIFSGSTREAEALYKAGEVAGRLKKEEDSRKAFARLQKDFPNSKWAQMAKERGWTK